MTNKKNEYEPFDTESALSVDGINALQINLSQLKSHNDGMQEQNKKLQKEKILLTKALELAITDFCISTTGKELTDEQMKVEIKDYKQQAEIKLNEETQCTIRH